MCVCVCVCVSVRVYIFTVYITIRYICNDVCMYVLYFVGLADSVIPGINEKIITKVNEGK